MKRLYTYIMAAALFSLRAEAAEPIIDMHVHAQTVAEHGPTGKKMCFPADMRAFDPGKGAPWPAEHMRRAQNPDCERWTAQADADAQLMAETIAALERHNIIAVAGGLPDVVEQWREAAPERIIPSRAYSLAGPKAASIETLKEEYEAGRYRVLGEVTAQYSGFAPDDPAFDAFWAFAEENDIPVGIHMGGMPPGSAYLFGGRSRIAIGDPLLLEEVLVKHPKLRVYVMHAGHPYADNMTAMLMQYPQLYVGIGVLAVVTPREEFNAFLTRLVRAGLGDRILFGSDQMVWPGIIDETVKAVEKAPLTKKQKRDIFYNNAARFLRLSNEEIAAHHALTP